MNQWGSTWKQPFLPWLCVVQTTDWFYKTLLSLCCLLLCKGLNSDLTQWLHLFSWDKWAPRQKDHWEIHMPCCDNNMPATKKTAWGQLSLPQPSASLAFLSPLLKLVQGHFRFLAENISLLASKPQRFNIYCGPTKVESERELEVGVIWVPLLESWEKKTVQISCLRAHLHFASSCNKEHIVYHASALHKYPSRKRNHSPLKYRFWLEKKRFETSFLAPPRTATPCFTFRNKEVSWNFSWRTNINMLFWPNNQILLKTSPLFNCSTREISLIQDSFPEVEWQIKKNCP